MKKRILGILTVLLAVGLVFTMVSCDSGGGGTKQRTVTFDKGFIAGTTTVVTGTPANMPASFKVKDKSPAPAGKVPEAGSATAPTLAGHTFAGWEVKEGAVNIPYVAGYLFTKDTTLYATWVATGTTTDVTLTFRMGESSGTPYAGTSTVPANIVIPAGTTLAANNKTLPADPVWAGHVFDGWFAHNALTTPFTATTVVAINLIITAGWDGQAVTVDMVEISFDLDYADAPAIAPISIPKGTALGNQLPAPTRTGYTFNYWLDGTTQVTADTVFNADKTLKASWTIDQIEEGYVRISFDLGYSGPAIAPIDIPEDTPIGAALPTPAARPGWAFSGWWNSGFTVQYTASSTFDINTTLYAKWVEDVLTEDLDAELVFVENGAYVLYQFDIPADKKLSDYNKVAYDVKLSAGGKQLIEQGNLRHARLYGAYSPADTVSTDGNGVKYFNLNNYNAPFIIAGGLNAAAVNTAVPEADTWTTIELELYNSPNASYTSAHPDGRQDDLTGTVYFGVGISGNYNVNGAGDNDPAHRFFQMLKNVKLVASTAGTTDIAGVKPEETTPVFPNPVIPAPQFVSYATPLVYSWRGQATQSNIDNWLDLLPKDPVIVPFNRGTAPALGDLVEVDLGDFTYLNSGNPNNQRGWVSFEEAGRANDQSSLNISVVQFQNFNKAWYLELTTTAKPTGTVSLVWMGGHGGFNSQSATDNTGAALTDISEIIDNGDGTFTIRFFLPNALTNYKAYYEENSPWAALALGYWGASNHNIVDLNVTSAKLLIEAADQVGDAEGIAFGYTFSLGSAPAGGNIITDVKFDGDAGNALVVTGVTTADEYRWYIGGALQLETGNTLTYGTDLTAGTKITVTLEAKTGGLWKSQQAFITLTN